jgi:hypothetical protein
MTNTLENSMHTSANEIRTEAAIVLRTVEHITYDLDYFSRTIRTKQHSATVINDIERHLGQARRNCAEATAIADNILRTDEDHDSLTTQDTANATSNIRNAFALLALADSAYLRAFEVAAGR